MRHSPFASKNFFEIPDGTLISPFLNPKDSMSNLPFDLVDGFSLAEGIIKKHHCSKIHVHPHVDQVTYVLAGRVSLRMKGPHDLAPYETALRPRQAVITRGGEFFQLVNMHDVDCHVLYISSPAYLFEKEGNHVRYDDSVVLPYSWEQLAAFHWQPLELRQVQHSLEARKASFERLKHRSRLRKELSHLKQ